MGMSFIRRRLASWLGTDLSLEQALERVKKRGTILAGVIDVGASDGRWSKRVMRHYPRASYLLIEAQKAHEPELKRFKSRRPSVDYVLAAASDREGEVFFDDQDLFGGLASHEPLEKATRLPAVTVDGCVAKKALKGPFLLKLDTHGFEIPIFEGAEKTLAETALIVVETYNFQVARGSRRFPEICFYLEQKGFRCVDLCDPMHRLDGAFWQVDLFFAPKNSPFFSSNAYDGK